MLEALDKAPGRELWDIGGGTGNYAAALCDRGWRATVVDRSPDMLTAAAAKGLPTLQADATALPIADQTLDGVTMISMLHQVKDWPAALSEARRVLRPGGQLAVTLLTAEHLREVTWTYWWFPSTTTSALAQRPTLKQLLEQLPGGEAIPLEIDDLEDASIAALCRFPERILDPQWRNQTTFFEQLTDHHASELQDGLERLRSKLTAGERPDAQCAPARAIYGDATLLTWTRPVH